MSGGTPDLHQSLKKSLPLFDYLDHSAQNFFPISHFSLAGMGQDL
jgi:hypothetical protein